ncbi:hypothetical protein [Nostoc sp.]|uniref:hypothetical protein n=1 Tax=Nostoc sp. TaxID=1180 RepID=UPI002FEF86A1
MLCPYCVVYLLKIAVNVICAISDRKQCSSSLEYPSSQGKRRRTIRHQAMAFLMIKAMLPTYLHKFVDKLK